MNATETPRGGILLLFRDVARPGGNDAIPFSCHDADLPPPGN